MCSYWQPAAVSWSFVILHAQSPAGMCIQHTDSMLLGDGVLAAPQMNKLKKMALMVVGQNLNTDELQGGELLSSPVASSTVLYLQRQARAAARLL